MPSRPTHDIDALDLSPFAEEGLTGERLSALIEEHEGRSLPALTRLWSYYRNASSARGAGGPSDAAGSLKPYRLAQERGLPQRLRAGSGATEVVIENDIAWRIEALVDFVFGKPLRILSTAPNEETRREIEAILDALWESSGGISLLQDMGLLGAVYGHADLALRTDEMFDSARRSGGATRIDRAIGAARQMRVELIEARRGIAMLDSGDYRRTLAYVIRVDAEAAEAPEGATLLGRVLDRIAGRRRSAAGNAAESLEILSAGHRQVYVDGRLALDRANELGALPVVHIQNASQPYHYEGLSDVEPLIPMQDELNTRLSDRAHRVTLQSFNMYLAKGLDALQQPGSAGTHGMRVAPGQVWLTDNPDASVQAFGGDGASPSEDAHIEQIRDAMDKISGVSPVAIGVIRARLGHLSSENALRITLMGVLSKTARKRVAYGRGIAEISRLALRALDVAGVYRTSERDRGLRIEWPDPLPSDERSRLSSALMKRDLGVPLDRVLAELGYAPLDAGVQ